MPAMGATGADRLRDNGWLGPAGVVGTWLAGTGAYLAKPRPMGFATDLWSSQAHR
jgi:hypothetical protein